MSELLKNQLNKYIETGKETKLEIFIQSCNPTLKLTIKKIDLLKELIEEYKQDPVVFEDILAFCGYVPKESQTNGRPQFTSQADIGAYLDAQNQDKYKNTARYDILDEVAKTHLGDIKDPNSVAYKVCNGQIFEFRFPQTAYKPDVVLKRLMRKNFVEDKYDWHSFWNDQEQCWVCTTNTAYTLKTSKKIGD